MSEMTSSHPTSDAPTPDFLSRPLLSTVNLDWEKTLYALFIIVAILSRLIGLGDRVVSHDESLHTQYAYQYFHGDGYQHSPLMHGPTLFHATAASFWLLGVSDFTARLPVAILGIILVGLPYVLRPWIGRRGALAASFLLLISPYITYYSRYIRHDIYLIVFAFIVFAAGWYYLQRRENKYLWWIAAGLALMFATMEAAYIYVAIFGSFLILRLLVRSRIDRLLVQERAQTLTPLIIVAVGGTILLGSFAMLRVNDIPLIAAYNNMGTARTDMGGEGGQLTVNVAEFVWRWVLLGGAGVALAGLFQLVRRLRSHLAVYPEFDLIMLYSTLLLPAVSAAFTILAGAPPLETSYKSCTALAAEPGFFRHVITVLSNGPCFLSFITSGFVLDAIFLPLLLAAAVSIGLWWDVRRWLTAAAIFHTIFLLFYTSFFTNAQLGWVSGMIGSLGYWLVQHNVQRGSQPEFYYFFVTPLYEFLPLLLALLAARLWFRQKGMNRPVGYWLTAVLLALLTHSLANWAFARAGTLATTAGQAAPGDGLYTALSALGLLLALGVAGYGIYEWLGADQREHVRITSVGVAVGLTLGLAMTARFIIGDNPAGIGAMLGQPGAALALFVLSAALAGWYGWPGPGTTAVVWQADVLLELPPYLLWWLILTWFGYSLAGEKMPWLSTHFVTPMALLGGWYINTQLRGWGRAQLLARRSLALWGLWLGAWLALALALKTWLLDVNWGGLQALELQMAGLLIGRIVTLAVLVYLIWRLWPQVPAGLPQRIGVLSFLGLLALLTIRFNYMASFVNYDYTNEFMVYAHGAPATKQVVLKQLDELSMRLKGDKTLRVSYDEDIVWPFIWYLRDYPNKDYFAANPSAGILESPVLIVGNDTWGKVDPIVQDDYVYTTFSYLSWPMEEYRKFSWNAFFGVDGTADSPRGLGSRDVRQALYNIFFYRDYQKYGEVFGGNYDLGQWPLRDDLRLYIRKDVFSELWDFGTSAIHYEPPPVPYAANELTLTAAQSFGSGGDGQLNAPRNVAVGLDGNVYVADSGNNRIVVFGPDGQFVRAWGSAGSGPSQFNEPWGLAVDKEYVYVADTWNYRIQKFTLTGDLVQMFGSGGASADPNVYFGPRAIALWGDNQLLITDTGNHRVQVVTRDGVFVSQFGGQGGANGQFNEPVGLAAGADGAIFVAEAWNRRVQQFTSGFAAVGTWAVDAWGGTDIGNKPYIALDNSGHVYVTDPEGYRVLIFDRLGNYVAKFGRFGSDLASLNIPNGLTVDAAGNIYVADSGNNRVLKFGAIDFGSIAP